MISQVNIIESKELWDKAAKRDVMQVPFFTHQWHTDWNTVFRSFEPLYLIVDNDIVAPFVKNGTTAEFSGGGEIADYLDIIGPNEKKSSAWPHIISYLKSLNVTSLNLRNVPESSPTLDFFKSFPSTTVTKEDTTPKFLLASSWDVYIESLDRKYRHELERKIRKFERENPSAHIVESDKSEVDVTTLLELMQKDEAKREFLTEEMKRFFRTIVTSFVDSISLLFVVVDNNKIAATLSFIQNQNSYLYNSGFDKEHYPNASFYLKAMTIKKSFEKGIREYNFLQGNERYKYELGGQDFFVYTINASLS